MNVVYGLFDPRTKELRYVGKTVGKPKTRLYSHISESKYGAVSHNANWIRSLLELGLRPTIEVLEEVLGNEEDLNKAEIRSIAFYKALGCKLTNQTLGGEGASGHKASPETRLKMSIARKGCKFSESHKKAISFGLKGKKKDLNHIEKLRIAGIGRVQTTKTRTKMSLSHGGKPFKDQYGNVYQTQNEAAYKTNTDQGEVWRVLHGKRKTHQRLHVCFSGLRIAVLTNPPCSIKK